ncbi:glycosyltransferase family 2 protein [bacterium]|nr:glycosyltransferase family 2 protein [bacterium]
MPTSVSIIIPHHHGRAHLKPLLKSLTAMETNDAKVKIIIADNQSSDGSREYVRKKFPDIEIIEFEENLGFAPALNECARQVNSDWLVFLNNDVHVANDWLMQLLVAAKNTVSACVSSHLLSWDGRETQFAGGWTNWFGKGFEAFELESSEPYEIFFPCGCGMMAQREIFLDAGGFDDDYFMIYEDVDLGWRLRLFGQSVWLAPKAQVFHRGHASLNKVDYARKAICLERNSLATLYKNLDAPLAAQLTASALRDAVVRARGLAGAGLPVRYSSDGLSTLRGVQAFFDEMPQWREKREHVQRRRIVSDEEIFEQFFPHPDQTWAYTDEHYRRLADPDIEHKLQLIRQDVHELFT